MKKQITWDFFASEVLPNIPAKANEGYKQTVIGYLAAKEIEVLDAEGKAIDLETVVVMSPPAPAPENNKTVTNPDEDDDDLDAMVTRAVEKATKAITDNEKRDKPKTPTVKWAGIPATVRRVSSVKNFKGKVNGYTAEERAYRFGMWALAQLSMDLPQRYNFEQAKQFTNDYICKLHQGNVNTTGGYLVPDEFGTDLIDLRETFGVARRILKIRPMTSDTRTDPRRTGGLTAYFVAEGAAITESTKSWDQVSLVAKDVGVLSRMTNQLNQDAVISIGDDLAGEIAYSFSDKEDDCAINGDGTSTYGGITGFRQKLSDINGTDDGGGLVLATGNTYNEVAMADLTKMIGLLPQYADTPRAAWVCHRVFYFSVMVKLLAAQGGSTMREAEEGPNRRHVFQGYPVEISQKMPSTQANSQICLLLGDFSLAASFGDRQQDSIMFSEHAYVNGQSVFERNEIAIRGTERFDVNVHDVGTATAAGPVVGLILAAS